MENGENGLNENHTTDQTINWTHLVVAKLWNAFGRSLRQFSKQQIDEATHHNGFLMSSKIYQMRLKYQTRALNETLITFIQQTI